MMSAIDHFTGSLYSEAWKERPADIMAYIMFAHARLDSLMRRHFASLYRPGAEAVYSPLLDELADRNVIISHRPWTYAQFTIPRGIPGVEMYLARDHRYNSLIPVDVKAVARACELLAGARVNDNYRAHPKTFAQMTVWNYDDDDTDEKMVRLMWHEEDWQSDLMTDIETMYYALRRDLEV